MPLMLQYWNTSRFNTLYTCPHSENLKKIVSSLERYKPLMWSADVMLPSREGEAFAINLMLAYFAIIKKTPMLEKVPGEIQST